MRLCWILFCLSFVAGCNGPRPSGKPTEPPGTPPPLSEAPVNAPDSSLRSPSSPSAPAKPSEGKASSPGAAQVAPKGYVLAYPGSAPSGLADEVTEGQGERNQIVRRKTPDSMQKVAAFYTDQLGVRETLSLPDRKILTGDLPGGGRVAITLTRPKGAAATKIEVVAATPL